MSQFVVLSGCSGGGKSTLLAELAGRGHPAVPEPGRRVVAEQLAIDGTALPWNDCEAFARRAIQVALGDLENAGQPAGWVFFDRGLVDAAAALLYVRPGVGLPADAELRRYHHRVFVTPPWKDIYAPDTERRHTFGDAVAEYQRLIGMYESLSYEVIAVPQVSVEQRADFVLHGLAT